MNEQHTNSILQRVPVILAVTAASYGLAQALGTRQGTGTAASSGSSAAANRLHRSPALAAH